jgi:hypothetical protein
MKTMFAKNCLWLLLLLTMSTINGQAEDLDTSKKKEINQSFNVSLSDKLSIDNRYGSVTITHWEKSEVAIRVVIVSKAGNESRAQEGLDRVQVDLKQSGNTVYGVTSLKSQTGWGDNIKLTIDYYVSMPSKLALSISQKYGDIILPPENEGDCFLEVKYGNIMAGSFKKALRIDAGYSNLTLQNTEDASLDLAYCGNVKMGNVKDLSVDSKYSNIKLLNANKLSYDGKYGNLTLQEAAQISMDVKYSEITIDRLKEDLSGELQYTTVVVKALDDGFKRVNLDARYGNITLSVSTQAAFNVSAENMKYGSTAITGLKVTESKEEDKANHYYRVNGGGSHIYFNGNGYSNLKINAL